MNKHTKLVLLVLLLVILCACDITGLVKKSNENQPRTNYESLDLSTPEAAVMTFSEAFRRDDFLSVYLVLAPKTQFILQQRMNLLQFEYWFQPKYKEDVFEDVTAFSEGLGHGEHIDSGWYLFDQVMLSAKENSALPIDLSGEVKIIDTMKSETTDGNDAVDIIATVEGIDEEVVFRMVQAPSRRWGVY